MRVTNQMLVTNYANQLQSTLSALTVANEQISSGRLLHQPSDNPFLVNRVLQDKTSISKTSQYERNIEDVDSFLTATDIALGQLDSQIQRLNELSVQAGSETYSPEELAIIKKEVDEIAKAMVDTLNTKYDNHYLFAGDAVQTKPFEYNALAGGGFEVLYHGDDQHMSVNIAEGSMVDRNVTGTTLLDNGTGESMFEVISNMSMSLEAGDNEGVRNVTSKLKDQLDHVLKLRGTVGSRQQRLELMHDQSEVTALSLKESLSLKQDTDIAKKALEVEALKTGYMATLQISSQVIQPSLLQFLNF